VQYFKDEYVAHWENGGCPFDHAAATLFATAGAAS
jgi:NADH-quinone oxidoreductase subunit F